MNKCEWVTYRDNEVVSAFCGSDSVFYVDGRLGNSRVLHEAYKVKKSYTKNFPHKAKLMTYFKFKNQIIGKV